MCPLRGLTSKKGITSCHAPESPLPQLLDTPLDGPDEQARAPFQQINGKEIRTARYAVAAIVMRRNYALGIGVEMKITEVHKMGNYMHLGGW